MNSNIAYNGKVTVKVKGKPPVKTKNEGSIGFFNLLYDILAQKLVVTDQSEFAASLPTYITLVPQTVHISEDDFQYEDWKDARSEIVLKEMPIVERKVKIKNKKPSLLYECLLTNANIQSNINIEGNSDAYVLLLDGRKEKILAYTPLSLYAIQDVASNSYNQATITWEMTFTNTEVTT